MDQFANMNGKKDHVILLDCKSLEYEYFPLILTGYKIVLVNSKVHHSLATGEYNIRRQRCEEGMRIIKNHLPAQSFRDLKTIGDLDIAKSEMLDKVYNCCRFVIEEIGRTKKAATLLQQHDVAAFGKLMFETHEGLSKLYEVSCEELDFLVEQAKKYPAVIGARLMGGGFGGCTINIVAEDGIANFIEDASREYQLKFDIVPEAYIVETEDGTKAIAIRP
jgi:galactokinase